MVYTDVHKSVSQDVKGVVTHYIQLFLVFC